MVLPALKRAAHALLRAPCRRQFLESYKSVTLESMASAFDVSAGYLDSELVDFICAGRLHAKIDKVAGVIETNRCNCGVARERTGARPASLGGLRMRALPGRLHGRTLGRVRCECCSGVVCPPLRVSVRMGWLTPTALRKAD